MPVQVATEEYAARWNAKRRISEQKFNVISAVVNSIMTEHQLIELRRHIEEVTERQRRMLDGTGDPAA